SAAIATNTAARAQGRLIRSVTSACTPTSPPITPNKYAVNAMRPTARNAFAPGTVRWTRNHSDTSYPHRVTSKARIAAVPRPASTRPRSPPLRGGEGDGRRGLGGASGPDLSPPTPLSEAERGEWIPFRFRRRSAYHPAATNTA